MLEQLLLLVDEEVRLSASWAGDAWEQGVELTGRLIRQASGFAVDDRVETKRKLYDKTEAAETVVIGLPPWPFDANEVVRIEGNWVVVQVQLVSQTL